MNEESLPPVPVRAAPLVHRRRRLIAGAATLTAPALAAAAFSAIAISRGGKPVRQVPVRQVATLTEPGKGSFVGVTSVAFSPDGRTLAGSDIGSRSVFLWRLIP
jgi:hypothetical protein